MRAQLNLPNSSNPVERSNNLVTAKRQKHHGMSWSDDGSYALTALNALTVNKTAQQWLQKHSFELSWPAKAAKAVKAASQAAKSLVQVAFFASAWHFPAMQLAP